MIILGIVAICTYHRRGMSRIYDAQKEQMIISQLRY